MSTFQITITESRLAEAIRRAVAGDALPILLPAGVRHLSDGRREIIVASATGHTLPGRLAVDVIERFRHPTMLSLPEDTLALLSIGQGTRLGRARAWIRDQQQSSLWQKTGRLLIPDRLLAESLHPVGRAPVFGADDSERWSRTRKYLGEAHDRLRGMKIGIVGVGRLGSVLLRKFADFGCSQLTFIDPDKISLHNCGEGGIYRPENVGHSKAHVWANSLARDYPEIRATAINQSITRGAAVRALSGCDVIFSCADNPLARTVAASVAAAYQRTLLDIGSLVHLQGTSLGSSTMGADVRLVLPGRRCLLCFGGLDEPAGQTSLLLATPDLEAAMLNSDGLDARGGSLDSLNSLAISVALRFFEELALGHMDDSAWLRADFDNQGRLQTRYIQPTTGRGPCFCELAGMGDSAAVEVLPILRKRAIA